MGAFGNATGEGRTQPVCAQKGLPKRVPPPRPPSPRRSARPVEGGSESLQLYLPAGSLRRPGGQDLRAPGHRPRAGGSSD